MAIGQTLPLNALMGALPNNYTPENWQAAANMFASRLQISIDSAYSLFNIASVLPDQNIGPILLNGLQWYVWSDDLGQYIIMPLDGTQLKFIISPTAPDPNLYLIWWQLDSSNNPVAPNYYNSSASPPAWQPFGYSIAQIDAFFSGTSTGGQKQITWANVLNIPALIGGAMLVGTTVQQNALTPQPYNLFYNSDINALLIYYGGTWHTVDGVPGDIKYVSASTLAGALANNPGWIQNVTGVARFVVAAGDGSGSGLPVYTNGQTGGEGGVTLVQNQLPASLVGLTVNGPGVSGDGAIGTFYTAAVAGADVDLLGATITNPGGGQPIQVIPPFVAYWQLIKS